jgi:hypothetical protein
VASKNKTGVGCDRDGRLLAEAKLRDIPLGHFGRNNDFTKVNESEDRHAGLDGSAGECLHLDEATSERGQHGELWSGLASGFEPCN